MSEEKTIEDFFKAENNAPVHARKRYKRNRNTKEKTEKRDSGLSVFFKKRFSFDYDVNLSDPTNVLYRRNYCINSIITVANLVFFLFSLVGISKSNFILTIVFFLLQATLSQTINYMLRRKKDDYNHQQIIMYLQCLFVFILSIVLYIKVYLGFTLLDDHELSTIEFSITQAAYLLIFFTFVIISLYQDTKLLRITFTWSFVVMFIINITALHPDLYSHASSLNELYEYVFGEGSKVIVDIVLRTFVLIVFYISLYTSASVSHHVYQDRTSEIERRMDVETNFKDIVESVFESVRVYNTDQDSYSLRLSAAKVSAVAKEIGVAMNYSSATIMELTYMATIHSERIKELELDGITEINPGNFDVVLKKTQLATIIIKRLQISKKAEDIVYRFFEGVLDKKFLERMSINPEDYESNILLISEIYNILRTDQSYKKALTHQRSVELIEKEFSRMFDPNLVMRFMKFSYEISIAYDKA